jgi:hypothetical protein
MHGELLAQTVQATPKLDSFTLKVRTLGGDGTPAIRYVRVLTIDTRICQLYFIPKDRTGKVGEAQRTEFFEGFNLTHGN